MFNKKIFFFSDKQKYYTAYNYLRKKIIIAILWYISKNNDS